MKTERRPHNGRATQTYSSRTPVMVATECPGRRLYDDTVTADLTWSGPEAREVQRDADQTLMGEEEVVLWMYNLA